MRVATYLLIALFIFTLVRCSDDDGKKTINPPTDSLQVSRIEDVLNGDDQELIDLLNNVRGSVGKRGFASKTVWSRKNDFGLGLYVSANHVIGIDSWQTRNEEFIDITTVNNGIFETSQLPLPDGAIELGNTWIADFPLYHYNISADAINTTILPVEDFYLGIVDNQRVEDDLVAQTPDFVQTHTSLQMFDPGNRTTAAKTWNTAVGDERVILVGYPQDASNFPNGAVLYSKVLTDAEAEAMITELKHVGDPEGDIPYQADVEFFVSGQALPGMSGGGAFNSQGQYLGVMVRASDVEGAPRIVRVVRIDYILHRLATFYNSLSQADKDRFRPFVSGEL